MNRPGREEKPRLSKEELAALKSKPSIFDDEPEIDVFKVQPTRTLPRAEKEPSSAQKAWDEMPVLPVKPTIQFSKRAEKPAEPPEKLSTLQSAIREKRNETKRSIVVDAPKEEEGPPQRTYPEPKGLIFPWEVDVSKSEEAHSRRNFDATKAPRRSVGAEPPQPAKKRRPAETYAHGRETRRPATAPRAAQAHPSRASGRNRDSGSSWGAKKSTAGKAEQGRSGESRAHHRPYRKESFWEKHLRSLIAMVLLVITVAMMLMWTVSSSSGQRMLAQLGLGGAAGYIILGDECMSSGNYTRAVEHYYKALTKGTEYESAFKLARAYRQTGDIDREVSALLLCIDQFEDHREPYERLKEIYPFPSTRPAMVKEALLKGVTIFSDITLAY